MKITAKDLAQAIETIRKAAHALDDQSAKQIVVHASDLIEVITAGVPRKDDGSAYTDEELAAAREEAKAPWQAALDRDSR